MAFTIKDVSKAAGVSTATVSHVINGTRFVSEETKEKVLSAMESLNYHPNSIARSLRSQRTNTIGVLVPSIKSFFYTSVTDGIEETLMKNGYNIILSNSHEMLKLEKTALANFKSLRVDGLIMCPVVGEHSYLKNELKTFPPVVFIDRKLPDYQGDCVVIDHIKSTYDVVDLLIKKGHTRIGMVTGYKEISTTKDRIAGYKMAIQENGLVFNENFIKSGSFQADTGYAESKDLYESEHVSAMFFADDPMVIGSLRYFKDMDIKIPEQVSIISCNDYEWTSISKPALTIVKKPSTELGRKAAEILLNKIKKKQNASNSAPREIRMLTSIVERESVLDLREK